MHDLIDRKAAIDILDAYQVMVENGEENPYSWARFRMSELPSAQPEIIRCRDCVKRETCRITNIWAVAPDDDWFCGDAERRIDDGE